MNKRFEELDSLRGVAALFVVFFHFYQVLLVSGMTKMIFELSPLRLFISGGESVILFFVLSGFVLSLQYFKGNKSRYVTFMIKRFCRIYLPYLAAVLLSIASRELFYRGNQSDLSDWINSFWGDSLNINILWDHFLLLGTFLSNLNPVVWSLVHEMRISIIFPIVMILIVKFDWKKSLVLCSVLTLISILAYQLFTSESTGTEHAATLNYTGMFIVGALLAKYRNEISYKFIKLTRIHKILLFCFGLGVYLLVHPSFVIKTFIYSDISPFYRTVIDSWFVTFGASIIIIFALNSTVISGFLRNKFINFLGKISYSLYLIHVVVLLTMIQLLHRHGVPTSVILVISLIVSFVVASLMFFYIEKPSIMLGRLLISRNKDGNNINEESKNVKRDYPIRL
ncbi:acyltransferase family protein [Paenibacillus sp. LjRoot56]|uniref:acyltransferase family protein n=1 Tax=Paenibacillus sp. LjRoot56 TaxID=3342333 RepID=UPI003ECFA2DA